MFQGRVKELENVLIDNFKSFKNNTCFFLSHCHTDHMEGLSELLSNLDRKVNQYLYCSPISYLILINKFNNRHINVIKKLTSSQVICVPENKASASYSMTVTPIPAGHCPGSVMFLFETVNKNILYTGDFRIMEDDISKFKAFHSKEQIKSIDNVYLDTTFLNEEYWNFPARSELVMELVKIIKDWLTKGPNYNVFLETSAKYGYEYVFVELARNLRCKIHVNGEIYDLFWNIPEVGSELTKDCHSTNIHAFGIYDKKKCLASLDEDFLLKIKLSAQWYKSGKGEEKEVVWKDMEEHFVRACYSNHSSCSELVTFLNYLKPKRAKACVNAVHSTEEDTKAYLRRIISSWSDELEEESPEPEECNSPLQNKHKFKLKFPSREEEVSEYFLPPPLKRLTPDDRE